jgi:acetyltransferase
MTMTEPAGALTLKRRAFRKRIRPFGLDPAWERLRDGTALRIRPLRPEDEPVLHNIAAHMSQEDLRLRFLHPVKALTNAVAARLSQLDHNRELRILAERDGTALAVAHLFADPTKLRAEFAVAVRSDSKGHGIGYLLMTRLIDIARESGMGELFGWVLRENEPMLQLCRKLRFAVAPEPAELAILVSKSFADN